jgi:hypothetical protein
MAIPTSGAGLGGWILQVKSLALGFDENGCVKEEPHLAESIDLIAAAIS